MRLTDTATIEREPEQATEHRDILVITGSSVKVTDRITYMFMIQADPSRTLWKMPQKFGYIWKDKDGGINFNVFQGGRGLVVGGGFDQHDTLESEKEKLDAIPSCTVLIDVALFSHFKELMDKHRVPFRYYHSNKELSSG